MQEEPFFMSDPSWHRCATPEEEAKDPEGKGYLLTDEAPAEAVASYNEFYAVRVDSRGFVFE